MALNIADLFEHTADSVPDLPAVKVGARALTFRELDVAANRLAHFLAERGIGPGDHVALYAKNSIEHVVALLATLKVRAVSINVNYRYVEGELDYLFDNSDAVAVLHDRTYAPVLARCVPRHPRIHTCVALVDPMAPDDESDLSGFGGLTYAEAIDGRPGTRDFGPRSGDDIHIIYTGGTTGFPKGVMWRHEDYWRVFGGGTDFETGALLGEFDQSEAAAKTHRMVKFPLSPLMHGGAQTGLLRHLFVGDLTILEPKFDPATTWDVIDRERVQFLFLTGDAMARPLIEEYQRRTANGLGSGSSLVVVASSAAVFSPEVKNRWLDNFPNTVFTDSIGATETGFQGTAAQSRENVRQDGPRVALGPDSVVLDDNGHLLDLTADVGAIGQLARAGRIPLGYYNDPVKTAETFKTINGIRYVVPGDRVRIEPGARVTLLGRGSNCVNTGGEKVYVEEVEAAIKAVAAVYDCIVVGVPDERFGNAVAAVVELRPGHQLTLDELRASLRTSLAGYKLPRVMTTVPKVPRNDAGKAQYPRARELASSAAARWL
ncbi:acyl-CoA synthetase [Nocardia sp. NPDC003979]